MSDNLNLAEFLKVNFIGKLGAFRDAPAFADLPYMLAQSVRASGDPMAIATPKRCQARGSPSKWSGRTWRTRWRSN